MREIPLTKGKVALVDDEDYARLALRKWHAVRGRKNKTWYAYTMTRNAAGRRTSLPMHRAVLSAPRGLEVDHRDQNGLNNTRGNLRIATHAENQQNRPALCSNTSGFKGVYWRPSHGRWCAQMRANGKRIHVGYYDSPREAHAAYAAASAAHHGEFGRTG